MSLKPFISSSNAGRRVVAGFTLVELLVVIAIISILAALLLPALGRTKLTAKRVACMQQMKQVSLALQMLGNENSGWLNGINAPLDSAAGNTIVTNWLIAVHPYLGGGVTPAGEDKMVTAEGTGCPGRRKSYYDTVLSQTVDNKSPFGVNGFFTGVVGGAVPMHSLNEVVNSTRIFLIADSCYPNVYTLDPQFLGAYTIDGSWSSGTYIHAPHPASPNATPEVKKVGNGLNCIFVDGHGEFLKRYGVASWDQVTGFTYGKAVLWPNTGTYDMMGE